MDSQDNGTKEADGVKRVTTRLVDNHPITEADRNPRYFLSHLTEDKLDPNVPVFKEDRLEFPDNYSETCEVSGTDEYGHTVVSINHIPSKKEQNLNNLGFMLPREGVFGVNHFTPPVIGNDPAMEMDEEGSDKPIRAVRQEKDYDEGTYDTLQADGEYLNGTVLMPGSDRQTELEAEQAVLSEQGRKVRRQRRRLELGYDHRDIGNTEPWVDTHRIEAIDARLRDLHEQRAQGSLEYPLEKDAAVEAQRIRAEEKAAMERIRMAIGVKDDQPLGDRYLYQQDDAVPRVRTHGLRVGRRVSHKPIVAKPVQGDASLDAMDVYAIPVEKLYQARRQELERLRSTHYEDFDLSYLLERSGKPMEASGARSLYESRHGHTESDRPATAEEKENALLGAKVLPQRLSAAEKAELGQQLALYERFSGLSTDEAMRLYSPKLRIITPEMEAAEKEVVEKKAEEDPSLASELFGKKEGEGEQRESDGSGVTKMTVKDASEMAVSPAMDEMVRDPNKPLEDYEVGLNKKGDVMFAWRTQRSQLPDYQKDKEKFMNGVMDVINKTEVTPEEEKEARDKVITTEMMEESRRNVGQPDDVSAKTFHKRYLRGLSRARKESEVVGEVMTGFSMERPEEMLKTLGLDTEDGVEAYLMDTFKSHKSPDDKLLPPEHVDTLKLMQKASRVLNDAKAQAEKAKAEKAQAESGEAKPEETASGDAKPEEAKEEAKPAEETKEEAKPAEETKEEAKPAEETKEEAKAEEPKPAEEGKDTKDAKPTEDLRESYTHMSPMEALQRLQERFEEDGRAANTMVPTEASYTPGMGHIVDALEYSDQVYVHEKDREMIFRMYKEGIHPQEISKTFGFNERRVYAILRLMKQREQQKEGALREDIVKEFEENESPFTYDYRDMPPADMKKVERRREGHVPEWMPRFVFLQDEEEEEQVMREVNKLVQRRRREQAPTINRAGLREGASRREGEE